MAYTAPDIILNNDLRIAMLIINSAFSVHLYCKQGKWSRRIIIAEIKSNGTKGLGRKGTNEIEERKQKEHRFKKKKNTDHLEVTIYRTERKTKFCTISLPAVCFRLTPVLGVSAEQFPSNDLAPALEIFFFYTVHKIRRQHENLYHNYLLNTKGE